MTDAECPVITAFSHENATREFPVPVIPEDEKRDTNGAGDAFVGGFLAQFIMTGGSDVSNLSKNPKVLEECIKIGYYAASKIIRISGCDISLLGTFDPKD